MEISLLSLREESHEREPEKNKKKIKEIDWYILMKKVSLFMIHSAIDFQYSSSSVFAGVPFVYSFFIFQQI